MRIGVHHSPTLSKYFPGSSEGYWPTMGEQSIDVGAEKNLALFQ